MLLTTSAAPTFAVGLAVSVWAFETLCDARQWPLLQQRKPPAALQPYLGLLQSILNEPKPKDAKGDAEVEPAADADKPKDIQSAFEASQSYARDKMRFSFFADAIGLIESILMLSPILGYILPGIRSRSSGWSGYRGMWDLAGSVLSRIHPTTSLLVHSLAFVVLLTAFDSLTSIPVSLYKTFVLEAKHGFNKTTIKTYVLDLVKGWAIGAIIGLPVIAGLVKIIEWAGPGFVKWTMLGIVVLQLAGLTIYPYLIAPLFNKFTPLRELPQHAEVQRRIEALAKKLGFPLGNIWVVDGSKRTAHSNAAFYESRPYT